MLLPAARRRLHHGLDFGSGNYMVTILLDDKSIHAKQLSSFSTWLVIIEAHTRWILESRSCSNMTLRSTT